MGNDGAPKGGRNNHGVAVQAGRKSNTAPWRGRLLALFATLFADKEIFFRTQGHVRFLRISRRVQLAAAGIAAALLLGWLIVTVAMAWNQIAAARTQALTDARARRVAAEARRVNAYKRSVGDIAQDVTHRQDLLDDMVRSQFGPTSADPAVVGAPDGGTRAESDAGADEASGGQANVRQVKGRTIGALVVPGAARLAAVEDRQSRFARRLAALVDRRAQKVAAAIRSFGLDPDRIAGGTVAEGGPYIPWREALAGDALTDNDGALSGLARSLAHLDALERGLIAIPSGRPTASPMLTSSYGYRRDPFNHRPAFHAGLDFPGRYGQPIIAAAAGRISFVGQRSGYGNVVEIDHGHGIMTRYAHLSGFAARPGERVKRGDAIGRMGSTGRSTGTHLHFEVRLNGNPINPRRFLEVRQDVLKIQQIAKQRFARTDDQNRHG